jgi:hypothetical protein
MKLLEGSDQGLEARGWFPEISTSVHLEHRLRKLNSDRWHVAKVSTDLYAHRTGISQTPRFLNFVQNAIHDVRQFPFLFEVELFA